MVKALGAVMTELACGYLGFKVSFALKKRVESLSDIISSLEALEGEIEFSQNRLYKALKASDRNGLFETAADLIDEMGAKKAWRTAIDIHKDKMCLEKKDCEILLMLGDRMGMTDADDQIKNIRYVKTQLGSLAEQAEEDRRRFGRLFAAGGVLAGLMVIILLI